MNRIHTKCSLIEKEAHLLYSRGRRKYLNAEERVRFHEAASAISDANQRTFCLTLLLTGCRISEALRLHPSEIDSSDGILVFRTLKQRQVERFRAIPVPKSLITELEATIQLESEQVWEFGRTWGWTLVKRCMGRAGLSGIQATPKGLRHGLAVSCVENGIPLTTIQKWLGHTSLETTKIYLDVVGRVEHELAAKTWPKTLKSDSRF